MPVHYTGFVGRRRGGGAVVPTDAAAGGRICVSAGGGLVGGPLFRAAVEAAPVLLDELGLPTTIVTGPFLPAIERADLEAAAAEAAGCTVVGFVADLAVEMAASAVSVSQCGYNTAMDILSAGMPSVVVPYSAGREDEQLRRARRLEAIGAVTVLEAGCAVGPHPRRRDPTGPAGGSGRPDSSSVSTERGARPSWSTRCSPVARDTVRAG